MPWLALFACAVEACSEPGAERTATVASALTTNVSWQTDAIDLPYAKCFHGVAVADLDNDGHLDMALANGLYSTPPRNVEPSVDVRFGAGDGTFRSALSFPHDYYDVVTVQIADMDNDGALDVVASTTDDPVYILWGDGHGHFTSSTSLVQGQYGVTLADANHDGRLDLITANAYLNNGARGFTLKAPVTFGTSTSTLASVTAGDVNGDGKVDIIATLNDINVPSTVQIALGNGDGTFRSPSTINLATDSSGPGSPVLADFNGDHVLDLALLEVELDDVVLMLGDGHGSFAPESIVASGLQTSTLFAVDLDQDGKLDLLMANGGSDSTTVLFGKGDGTFGPPVDYGTGEGTQGLAVADFNEDCIPDLAIGNTGTISGDHGTFAMAPGTGKGTIKASRAYPVQPYGESIVVADFDGDHKPDTVLLRDDGYTGALDVYLSTSGTAFDTFTEYPMGPSGLQALGTADLNGDGKPDIYSGNFSLRTATVMFNDGSGGFAKSWSTQVTTNNTVDIATADMNGDSALDLVVLDDTQISVWQNGSAPDAGGTVFSAAPTFTVPVQAQTITAGDINGDGRPDVVAADNKTNLLRTFTNDGSTLTAGPTYATIAAPRVLRLVDLNGDGALDIVVSTSNIVGANDEAGADNGGVDVLLNDGHGGFGAAVHTRAASSTAPLDIADFNGDGIMDVVVAGGTQGYAVALINDGTGTLTPSAPLVGGETTVGIAASDFNGDGRPDVLLSDYYSDMLYLVLNEAPPAADAGTEHCPPGAGHLDAAADAPADAVAAETGGSTGGADASLDAPADSPASILLPEAAPPDAETDAAADAVATTVRDAGGLAESGVNDATADVSSVTTPEASAPEDGSAAEDAAVASFVDAEADAGTALLTDASSPEPDAPSVVASTVDADVDAAMPEGPAHDAPGCGCTTAGAPSPPIGLGGVTLALAVTFARRRRRKIFQVPRKARF